jgi:DedD protein
VERQVKERLVGAAVLMAAAIILIPEMLSGPDRTSHAEPAAAQTRDDAPIKTYTIDLSQSPNAQAPPAVIDNRAPPPEEPAPAQSAEAQPGPSGQAKPEVPQQSAAVTEQPRPQSQPPSQVPTEPVVEAPTAAEPARTPQRPLASSADAPTSGRWAVQVGTFSKQANAERLAKQLREQGQSAFVMPVKSGAATLYRVRIGPMKDRASAEATLRDVKVSSPGAAIVSQP